LYSLLIPPTCVTPWSSYFPWFDHTINIWWSV
jgi:hypothetical protein